MRECVGREDVCAEQVLLLDLKGTCKSVLSALNSDSYQQMTVSDVVLIKEVFRFPTFLHVQ